MPDTAPARRGILAPLIRPARAVFAVVLGGLLGAVAWLIVMQKAHEMGITDHEANAAVGQLLTDADGEVARRGFYGTVLAAVVVALVYRLLRGLAPRDGRLGRWTARAVVVGVAVLLVWGLVLGPLAGSTDVPAGLFGREAGFTAPLCAVLAALAAGLTLVRVVELVDSDEWWERKHYDLRESIDSLFADGSGGADAAGPAPGSNVEDHPPFRH